MGLRRAKGGELVGKEVKGGRKTQDECVQQPWGHQRGPPGPVARLPPLSGTPRGPQEVQAGAGQAGQKHLARGAAEHPGHGTQGGRV